MAAAALTVVAIAACGGSGGTVTTGASAPAGETRTGSGGASAEALFQGNCASCHKLAAAEATFGTYGPDLDELKPSTRTVEAQVISGGGIMPAFGKSEILTAAEIKAVSEYVAAEAGK